MRERWAAVFDAVSLVARRLAVSDLSAAERFRDAAALLRPVSTEGLPPSLGDRLTDLKLRLGRLFADEALAERIAANRGQVDAEMAWIVRDLYGFEDALRELLER